MASTRKATAFLISSSSPIWIIDSKTSDHMTENKSIMSSLDSMCSFLSVTLAGGFTSSIQDIGVANVITTLSLSSVLYVLSFSFSLLSISKITRALNYSVKFYVTVCEFQELEMNKMIDIEHKKDRLYFLDLVSDPIACSSSVSLFDYHCDQVIPLYQL